MGLPQATTTPFPSTRDKSAGVRSSIATSPSRTGRRMIPLNLGTYAGAAAGTILNALDLKRFAPAGGRILGFDAVWNVAGSTGGATASVTASLDGQVVTTMTAALAQAASGSILGAITPAAAPTANNVFTGSGGLLTMTCTQGGTPFANGSFSIVLYLEANDARDLPVSGGVVASHVVTQPGMLEAWAGRIQNNGSSGTTSFKARINGVDIVGATVSIAAAAQTSSPFVVPCSPSPPALNVQPGDIVDLVCTAVAVAASDVQAAPVISALFQP